jgi:hypothetical protein
MMLAQVIRVIAVSSKPASIAQNLASQDKRWLKWNMGE